MNNTKSKFIVFIVLTLTFFTAPFLNSTYAENVDDETGTVISEDEGQTIEAITCTLIVPANLKNGDSFFATISYNPSMSGTWTEKFIFNWPSTCSNFDSKTVRTKKFIGMGSVSASVANEVVPSETCIKGTFNAKVTVPNVCSATSTMTITNP